MTSKTNRPCHSILAMVILYWVTACPVVADDLRLEYKAPVSVDPDVLVVMPHRSDMTRLNPSDGFERHRFADDLRMRGWRVGKRLYFGQTRVADRWGIGLVLKKDRTVYGINHRGLQITRQF